MFQIVAVPFDAFQALPQPEDRWLLTCFSRYVDRAGKAFPSLRQLAADTRMSLASVCRRMAAMERLEVFHRERNPGGRYRYILAEAFRPRWPQGAASARGRDRRGVPAAGQGVSQAGTQEAEPTKQAREGARARDRFGRSKVSFGELPDDRAKWEARLRSWRKSQFWLPLWGARPGEAGCLVPLEMLAGVARVS